MPKITFRILAGENASLYVTKNKFSAKKITFACFQAEVPGGGRDASAVGERRPGAQCDHPGSGRQGH